METATYCTEADTVYEVKLLKIIKRIRNSKHTRFFTNAAWQYGLQLVRYLFPLLLLPYLSRVLEPDGYAVYAYVVAFMGFIQTFVDFGFNLSGTKLIAKAESVQECNRIIGAITKARLILCAIAFFVVMGISLFIPMLCGNITYVIMAYLAVCGMALLPDFVFRGKEDMRPITIRYFVSIGVAVVLKVLLIHSMADILWIPALDILASAIALIWSFIAAKRMFGTTIRRASFKESFHELKISGIYCISSISSVVFTSFTTLVIGVVISDSAQISYWALAMSAVNAVQSLYVPIVNSLYPHMVKKLDLRFARKLALVTLPVISIGTIAFAVLNKLIMLILGGQAYISGSYTIAMVAPVLFTSFYAQFCGWPIMGAIGKVKELTMTTFIAAAFSIIALISVSILGFASLAIMCIIRNITEAILFGMRLLYCMKYVFNRKGKQNDG